MCVARPRTENRRQRASSEKKVQLENEAAAKLERNTTVLNVLT